MDAVHLCCYLDSFRGFIYKPLTRVRCGSGFLCVFCRDVHFPSIIVEDDLFLTMLSSCFWPRKCGFISTEQYRTESSFSDLTVQLEAQFIQKRKAACWLVYLPFYQPPDDNELLTQTVPMYHTFLVFPLLPTFPPLCYHTTVPTASLGLQEPLASDPSVLLTWPRRALKTSLAFRISKWPHHSASNLGAVVCPGTPLSFTGNSLSELGTRVLAAIATGWLVILSLPVGEP